MLAIVAIIFTLVLGLFGFCMYMIFWQQTYYSVNIESYHRDNETLTEAYEKEKTLRSFLQNKLAEEKMTMIRELLDKDSLISRHRIEREKLLHEKTQALHQVQKLQHEKDSILNIIRSLQRVPE
ncbi:hypothetical protein D770_20330 [Flammeovirgaceae bacterium 311]|nr:hypothetical protein D770_20330 [Flammeovirgaceae bacterium 311]